MRPRLVAFNYARMTLVAWRRFSPCVEMNERVEGFPGGGGGENMADANGQPGLRVPQGSKVVLESIPWTFFEFASESINSPPNYLTAVMYNGSVSERTPPTRPRMSKSRRER